MSSSVNNNLWNRWSSDINEGITLINVVNQEIPNLDNATSYSQFLADVQQIQATIGGDGNLQGNPLFTQFTSGLQAQLTQIESNVQVIDPSTGQPVPISVLNGNVNLTIYPTYQQLGSGQICPWMPSPSQMGTIDGSDQDTWSDFMNTMWTNGDSETFSYDLPNGDVVNLSVICDQNGNFSVQVSMPTADIASQLQMQPNANLTNSLQTYMQSWQ